MTLGRALRAQIGNEHVGTRWIEMTAARRDGMAEALGAASSEPVPPLLILALLPGLTAGLGPVEPRMTVNYGLEWCRPGGPVAIGDRLRSRVTLLEVVEIPGGAQLRRRVIVENDLGTVVLEAETLARAVL